MDKLEALNKYFGYSSFRHKQGEIIDEILSFHDALGIMPTGAGKSICYQIPALLFDGVTIVISPLISLMKDQVSALVQNGVKAAFINSSLTEKQFFKAIDNISKNMYKIIYVAPERLESQFFVDKLNKVKISMIAVDEAHCISQWGQDFRPSYLNILTFIEQLSYRPVITAFTATATSKVKDDIIKILGLQDPYTIITGFDRPNLYFGVEKPKSKIEAIRKFLNKSSDKSGIIYCSTRKDVDKVYDKLLSDGFSITKYHAGLTDEERKENQDLFIYDQARIMVATNAFGMGIDKSNVSFVLHHSMPKDMESYYQEAGRAGRDGSDAECIIFFSKKDIMINKYLIEQSENTELQEHNKEKLQVMINYCNRKGCLRQFILDYFGEYGSQECHNCSNCLKVHKETDITIDAQKVLSCIARCKISYGSTTINKILKGRNDDFLKSRNLNSLSTFGIMKDKSERYISSVIDFLIAEGYIIRSDGQYPTLSLGSSANDILRNKKTILMPVYETDLNNDDDKRNKRQKEYLTGYSKELFSVLKKLRREIADENHVPPFIIFSDATLTDMCKKMPLYKKDFLSVSGVGEVKYKKYGDAFIEAINSFKNYYNI